MLTDNKIIRADQEDFSFLLFALGRALDVQSTDQKNRNHLSDLAKLAITAGFDWVYYAERDYVHISVVPDG